MAELPDTIEAAIAQSRTATQAAIESGYKRLQVELIFPELKAQSIAEQFLPTFENIDLKLKVFFPDAGAAALARRDWGKEIPFAIQDIGIGRTSIEDKIDPADEIFLLVEPSAVEIAQVEKLCSLIGDRPMVMLIPRLEDAGTVGIGYAARQLRDRFIKTLESCYYLRPLPGAILFRCYPSPWQLWEEQGDSYKLIAELPKKPAGDEIDQILNKTDSAEGSEAAPKPKKGGFFTELQRFLRALNN